MEEGTSLRTRAGVTGGDEDKRPGSTAMIPVEKPLWHEKRHLRLTIGYRDQGWLQALASGLPPAANQRV